MIVCQRAIIGANEAKIIYWDRFFVCDPFGLAIVVILTVR